VESLEGLMEAEFSVVGVFLCGPSAMSEGNFDV
jgi:hypothetical protein